MKLTEGNAAPVEESQTMRDVGGVKSLNLKL